MTRSEAPPYPPWSILEADGTYRVQQRPDESPGLPPPGSLLCLDLGGFKLAVDPGDEGEAAEIVTTLERYATSGAFRGGRRVGVGLPSGCRIWTEQGSRALVMTSGGYERSLIVAERLRDAARKYAEEVAHGCTDHVD